MKNKEIKLENSKKIREFFKKIVEQSVNMGVINNTLKEKEEQNKEKEDSLFGGGEEGGGSEKRTNVLDKGNDSASAPEEDKSDDKKDDENKVKFQKTFVSHELPKAEDISLDMIVSRLNLIRSGRSASNEDVAVELNHYFEDLSNPERLALLAFLTGLSEILTGSSSGEDAPEPEDGGVNIGATSQEKTASIEKQKKKKEIPTIPLKQKSGSGLEDTSPPITVGTRQTTETIRRKIRDIL